MCMYVICCGFYLLINRFWQSSNRHISGHMILEYSVFISRLTSILALPEIKMIKVIIKSNLVKQREFLIGSPQYLQHHKRTFTLLATHSFFPLESFHLWWLALMVGSRGLTIRQMDDDPPHGFNQTFVLKPLGDSFFVQHDFFRLALHHIAI